MIRSIGYIQSIIQNHPSTERTPAKAAPAVRTTVKTQSQTERSTTKSPLAEWAKSITARFRFKDRFSKALAPMLDAKTVDEMKLYFRALPQVVGLSNERPKAAHAILKKVAQTPKSLYVNFTSIACGNKQAVTPAQHSLVNLKGNHSLALDCIRQVSYYDQASSHRLLKGLFGNKHLTTPVRLTLFRDVMMSREFGKEALPKSFEQMMKHTTPSDRNQLVYPSMLGTLEKWAPHHPKLKMNQEITKEMLRGWISSCEIITDQNHRRAQKLLMLSPSARG
jgi:hypothetical protein